MSFLAILQEAVTGSLRNVLQMAMIVIPLMIFIEVFNDLHLMERLTSFLNPLSRFIGLNQEGNLPLLAGLLFGISYGAGVIISSARDGELTARDIYLVNLFLIICHSVLEDTLLFAAIGARWVPILVGRFMLACLICAIWSRWASRNVHPIYTQSDKSENLL